MVDSIEFTNNTRDWNTRMAKLLKFKKHACFACFEDEYARLLSAGRQ